MYPPSYPFLISNLFSMLGLCLSNHLHIWNTIYDLKSTRYFFFILLFIIFFFLVSILMTLTYLESIESMKQTNKNMNTDYRELRYSHAT